MFVLLAPLIVIAERQLGGDMHRIFGVGVTRILARHGVGTRRKQTLEST
jgi:hypothetical protein